MLFKGVPLSLGHVCAKEKNKNGTVSIQIIDKSSGRYRVVQTVGSSSDPSGAEYLWRKAYTMIASFGGQMSMSFFSDSSNNLIQTLRDVQTDQIQVDGPEKVFGKIFDEIGFGRIKQDLFRHLVITRLVYPGSKLNTIDYLQRYKGISIDISRIYRFLDTLHNRLKDQIQKIAFAYTQSVLGEHLSVVFYDITTLYFEASDEDYLRIAGFSKDGNLTGVRHKKIL